VSECTRNGFKEDQKEVKTRHNGKSQNQSTISTVVTLAEHQSPQPIPSQPLPTPAWESGVSHSPTVISALDIQEDTKEHWVGVELPSLPISRVHCLPRLNECRVCQPQHCNICSQKILCYGDIACVIGRSAGIPDLHTLDTSSSSQPWKFRSPTLPCDSWGWSMTRWGLLTEQKWAQVSSRSYQPIQEQQDH
jgi:hypothetical protein